MPRISLTRSTLSRAVLLALALGCTTLAQAKEGGDQYPNGAENWYAGAVPPTGNYFVNYAGVYSGTLRDGSGNKLPVKVRAEFDAARFVQVTDQKLLGADWAWHVIVPVVRQTLDVGGAKTTTTGLGDITVNPIILAWHSPTWHYAAGLDINLPTGEYSKTNPLKRIGANYVSVEPIFAASYLGQDGWEVSGKFMLNLKGKNGDTDYQSGNEFHADYLIGKTVGSWGYGVSGYYLKQLEDDKQGGVKVGTDGNRGQVFAFGPSIKYSTKEGTTLVAQWQHETQVENRFSGNKFWFKLIMPLR